MKGRIAGHKDTLLGAVVISGIVGVVAGILALLAGGIGWPFGCGISVYLLLGSVVIYSLLSDTDEPPTEFDSTGITSCTIPEPVVTLLYEVAVGDESFELQYDGTPVPYLKEKPPRFGWS